MSANVIRAEYGKLRAISEVFHHESEQARRLLDGIESQVLVLKRGRWEAESATEFFRSMDAEVLPALNRLLTAFDHAGDVMIDIIAVYKRAERDALAALPKDMEGIPLGGSGGNTWWNDLSDWVIANKPLWKTLGDIMDVLPSKEIALVVVSVVGTPVAGVIAYGILFGLDTAFTYLQHHDKNPGWRGVGIAALDSTFGAVADLTHFKKIQQFQKLTTGLNAWGSINQINGLMQLTGTHGNGVIGWVGDTLNLDPQLTQSVQNFADQLGTFTKQYDVGDLTYSGAEWIVDKAIGSNPAGAVDQNGFDGFEKMSTSLGVNGGAANFNSRPKLSPVGGGIPVMNPRSLDSLTLPDDTRAAFTERARAFTSYSADHLTAIARHENTPRMAISTGGQ